LFTEAVESAFSWKHHIHPVVSCATCWFFIATAIKNYHIFYAPVVPLRDKPV